MTFSSIITLGFLVAAVAADCPSEYSSIAADHTQCLTDIGTEIALSDTDKHAIVDKHNEFRANVNPTAGNMNKLVWNDQLAATALKWAKQCKSGLHDGYDQRKEPSFPNTDIGQNGAWGHASVVASVVDWHSEVKLFKFGVELEDAGHYTQVVSADARFVGCGRADCSSKSAEICNYAPGQTSYSEPYERSSPCSSCPGHCDASGKLCDCGDKICQYGTMDIATCTCQCEKLYSGDLCDIKTCPAQDPSYCTSWLAREQQQDPQNRDPCVRYSNIKYEICPFSCGVCP